MMLVLLYGACLVVSVLVSGVAARTVLSTTLVFLVSGAVIGQGGLGLVDLNAEVRQLTRQTLDEVVEQGRIVTRVAVTVRTSTLARSHASTKASRSRGCR